MSFHQGSTEDAANLGDLVVLEIGDDPQAWRNAGFSVTAGAMMLDGVEFRFTGHGVRGGDTDRDPVNGGVEDDTRRRGIRGWHLQDISTSGGQLDGLADVFGPQSKTPDRAAHPNGIDVIDHVVVATPNLERTIAAFNEIGLDDRRSRTFPVGDTERQQTFFWAGSTIIEMIGVVGESGDGPATFWGLALVSGDLDATAAGLGEFMATPKAAVQPGRRIATLRTRELGISVPVAVMTPHKGHQVR